MRWSTLFLLFFMPVSHARDFTQDFAVVFITATTEAKYGKIPLDRALIAQAIENLAEAGAKGVVLKFFYDLPGSAESDSRLAESMTKIPVLLQARIDNSEQKPNSLPARFTLSNAAYATDVEGGSGWIPLPALAANSSDVCFVDFESSPIPLIESYQGKAVKSLVLCAAELALGAKATINDGSTIKIGDLEAPLDKLNRVEVTVKDGSTFDTIEFDELIDGLVQPALLKDKVVVLAYDGPNIDTVDTVFGRVGAHRAFIVFLKAFYETKVQ